MSGNKFRKPQRQQTALWGREDVFIVRREVYLNNCVVGGGDRKIGVV